MAKRAVYTVRRLQNPDDEQRARADDLQGLFQSEKKMRTKKENRDTQIVFALLTGEPVHSVAKAYSLDNSTVRLIAKLYLKVVFDEIIADNLSVSLARVLDSRIKSESVQILIDALIDSQLRKSRRIEQKIVSLETDLVKTIDTEMRATTAEMTERFLKSTERAASQHKRYIDLVLLTHTSGFDERIRNLETRLESAEGKR
jgi:hypothetical protein